MIAFLVLVALLSFASSIPDEHHEKTLRAGSSDIIYNFFSRSNPDNAFQVRTSSIDTLANSSFVPGKYSLFIVHGWMNNNKLYMNTDIRKEVLKGYDANVIFVDWSLLAGKDYETAQSSVVQVGKYMGEFVKALQQKFGVEFHKLKFVGHSLGAHVVGIAGKALDGKVSEITGLDPAGSKFTLINKTNRLDSSDGVYVQVIHTNMGVLGINFNIGNSDYFPNGGRSQPGCGLDASGYCAHLRSYEYYSESLTNGKFNARKCDNYSNYELGRCINLPLAHMGRFETDVHAFGTYYLDTNDKPPYAKG